MGTVSENLAVEQKTVENHSLIIYLRGPQKWFKVMGPIFYTLTELSTLLYLANIKNFRFVIILYIGITVNSPTDQLADANSPTYKIE